MVTGCHNCRRGAGKWCVTCRAVDNDDIAIKKGGVYCDGNRVPARPECSNDGAAVQPEAAPRLPEGAGDAARAIIGEFALLSLDGLIFLHAILNGKSLQELAEELHTTRQRLHYRYKKAFKGEPLLQKIRRAYDLRPIRRRRLPSGDYPSPIMRWLYAGGNKRHADAGSKGTGQR